MQHLCIDVDKSNRFLISRIEILNVPLPIFVSLVTNEMKPLKC